MEFSADRAEIARCAPLLTEERAQVSIAATKMDSGADVDFRVVSRKLLAWFARQPCCAVSSGQRVGDLKRTASGWDVAVKDFANGAVHHTSAKFVFVGAGGGSFLLLQNRCG